MAVPFLSNGLGTDLHSARTVFLSQWVFLMLWGAVVLLCFFGEGLFDYARCTVRAWLASSFLVSLTLSFSFWIFKKGSAEFLGAGLLAIGFAIFIVLGIPSRDHALRGGLFAANASVVLLAGCLPFVLGSALIGFRFCGERRTDMAGHVSRSPCGSAARWLTPAAAAWLLIAILANLVVKGGGLTPSESPQLKESAETLLQWWIIGLLSLFAAGSGVAAWGLRRSRLARLALLVSLASLVLAVGLKILESAVSRVPYFTYHWGTPRWEPPLGWATVVLCSGVLLAGCLFWFWHSSPVPPGQQPKLSKGFALAVALLAVVVFTDTNYLRTGSEYVRAIVCLDREKGEIQWICESLAGPPGVLDRRNSPATPTPVVHGNRVFAYFGTAGLMSCDFQGKLLWTCRSLPYSSVYGAASSPVADDGVLVLVCDMPRGDSRVWGVAAISGRIIWSTRLKDDGDISGNNRTPEIKQLEGRTVVIVWRNLELLALDLQTGEIRWRYTVRGSGDVVTSSVSDRETLYLTHQAGTQSVSLKRIAAGEEPVLWRNTERGANCASPVLVHGLLFLVGDYGEAACIEAGTGKTLWRERLPGQYRSSVLAGDRHVYFSNTSGSTTVVACDRVFRKVAVNDLGESLSASFATADGDFFIRTERSLYRIGSVGADGLNVRQMHIR